MRQISHFLQVLAIEGGDVGLLESRGREDIGDLVTGTHGLPHELPNRRGTLTPRRFEPDLPGLARGAWAGRIGGHVRRILYRLYRATDSRCNRRLSLYDLRGGLSCCS